jgi:Protein of unknown function (DUF2508)
MFFRRKGWLRAEFDKQLAEQLNQSKKNWDRQNTLYGKSIDPFGEMEIQTEIAKAKYFCLLREAKNRQLSAMRYIQD